MPAHARSATGARDVPEELQKTYTGPGSGVGWGRVGSGTRGPCQSKSNLGVLRVGATAAELASTLWDTMDARAARVELEIWRIQDLRLGV